MADHSPGAIDTSRPHSARIWNHLLGGKDNYEADRAAAEAIVAVFPGMADVTRCSRQFLGRVVEHLVRDAGIRQFLDVGSGLPTADNTHEIAQRGAPEARIVYVDNDPLVLAHARALLTSTPEGRCQYIDADARDTDRILEEAARTLDFTRPVGLMLMGILGLVEDYAEARSVVRRLTAALPSGSYLGLNDGTTTDAAYVEALRRHNPRAAVPYTARAPEQIEGYFEGLDLWEPGVVSCPRWRPENPGNTAADVAAYGGVARKP
ncbi:SAM-dependent methyltransferase [Streptomyces sp. WMMC500]|uniref:SAM-dependent methyltransferase n=1 Tax=Streptomyces sp. WMMC500 TaxID=3015154 RepID=UPI00248B566D|nr:SAM-dependent methyltransferase [Streptomyces sp. WMMC500]WBB63077.1 SAM-dependent methyltransferase [Streptomyces sp. WMMC500]